MNFDFQQMKPVIQREFDEIFELYPTDMTALRRQIPVGGDAYARKRTIVALASEMCPVHVFPHYPFAFELDTGEARDVGFIGIGNECQRRSGVDFAPLSAFRELADGQNLLWFNDYTDFLHRTLDHDKLLRVGFRGVWEECERLNLAETDDQKRRWRELVMFCCECVRNIGLRLKGCAAGLLEKAQDEDARYNLSRIVHSANTPWDPPVTMFDALNGILCTCQFISMLDGVEMNAYGQLDRLIEPFYQRDLHDGTISEEEAYFLIQCFLHKTDMRCHFNDVRKTYDNGVSVMIGGCGGEGNAVYNDVTRFVLRAYAENGLINPKLNARASAESPREYLEALVALAQTGRNNLVVENDDYIIPMFLRMGLRPEDARAYVGNGCQEVICPNQVHSRAFVYINMPMVLLHTIQCDEASLSGALKSIYRSGSFQKDDFDALYQSFLANLRSLIAVAAEAFRPYEQRHAYINPEPMLSCFTADCVQSGRDNADGGARYNHKTLALVGFGTLCDSLLSLRRAYADGTEQTLLDALKADFEGYDALRRALMASKDRFGHSDAADEFAKALSHALAEVSRGITNAQGIEWRTSLFTYYKYREIGMRTGATPDGRRAGESLSRQMNMAKMPGLTAAALSMHALTEADFNDVGMFDFALPFSVSSGESIRGALTDYLHACLKLKLPVVQPNVLDVRALEEERDQKGTHPDLIVRVCGYSALFGQLPRTTQDEIIRRVNC